MNDRDDRWYLVRRWFLIAAFVPALLAEPGKISADTKVYLSVDPGRLLSAAGSMWDPSVGAGTVPHQNIGYLFPLGPIHWLLDGIGVPDWVAQRLVWGALVFMAAWGVCRLGRLLGWSMTMAAIAGFAYGFSPYVLSYLARLSVILFPWAAMPWLIVLAMQMMRRPRWRTAAAFAIVIALVGSVNATSLVLAGLGPIVWVIADLVTRRTTIRGTANGIARIGVLSLAVSAWWIAGLSVQGSFGLPILRFTETYRAIAGASTPAEVIRGFGYWFFYGGDRLDHWIGPSSSYTNEGWLILLGFGIAMFGLFGLLTNFARRGTIVALLAVGMIVSVGGSPVDAPTAYGTWFGEFAADSTIGGALRSTTRAMPLVLLALGAGLGALAEASRRWLINRRAVDDRWNRVDPRLPIVAAVAMVSLQFFPWFIGTMTTDSLLRADPIPAYVDDLAEYLDAAGDGRVLIVPGSDFAYPRAGGTIDPILPGVLDRPVLYRELVPQGSEATADLLNAYERRIHDGWAEPESWPTIARLFNASAIAVFNDHQHERFRLVRPGHLWPDLSEEFGTPDYAGSIVTDEPTIAVVDSLTYAETGAVSEFPIVAAWTDGDATDTDERPVSVRPAEHVLVLDGSGDGVVDLAGSGLLTPELLDRYVIRYRASIDLPDDAQPTTGTWWVLTDTNRKQGRRWSTIGSNLGPIEPADAAIDLVEDQGDQRLEVFGAGVPIDLDRYTVAEHRGDIAQVQASWTGSRIAYTPEDAPFMATDGDLATAWRTAVFEDAAGLELVVELAEPTTSTEVGLVQPQTGVNDRFITRARITVSGPDVPERSVEITLDEASRGPDGQRVELPPGPAFTTVRFEILADNLGPLASYAGRPGVGLAELRVPGVSDDRVIRLPTIDPQSSSAGRLSVVMTRERLDPATQNRFAAEPVLRRVFDLPNAHSFDSSVELRLASDAPDATIAAVLGIDQAPIADRRLRGSAAAWAGAAVDGDERTAWITPIDQSRGARLTLPLSGTDVGGLSVGIRTGDSYSIPRALSLTDGTTTVSVPADVVDGRISIDWPAELDAAPTSVTLIIDDITARTAPEYFSGLPQELPVAITEIDVLGRAGARIVATRFDPEAQLPSPLPAGLLHVDGIDIVLCTDDIAVRDVLAGDEVHAVACGGSLDLAEGEHRIDTTRGAATGLDVDRVVFDTGAAGSDAPEPTVDFAVERASSSRLTIRLDPASTANWLILEESWNLGWTATIDGRSLGEPDLVNGYSSGWLIEPGEARTVELEWTPQQRVRIGLIISTLSAAMILGLLVSRRRGDRDRVDLADHARSSSTPHLATAVALTAIGVVALGLLPTLWGLAVGLVAWKFNIRWLAAVGVFVGIGITGAWVTVAETLRDHADSPDWPTLFSWTAPLVWAAVAGVVATAAVPAVIPGDESPDTSQPPPAAP